MHTRPFLSVLLLLAACNGPGSEDSGDIDDTDDITIGPSGPRWTEGPEVPECSPATGNGDLVALSGVVLLPEGPLAGEVVYSRSSGNITCVGDDCDLSGADVVCTEGVISPGLINAHDHLQYNVIGPWDHGDVFDDRYDWQGDGRYFDWRTAYVDIADAYECETTRWAELRVLVGGGTSAVGAPRRTCIEGLVRNLDEQPKYNGVEGYQAYYTSSNVTSRFDSSDGADFSADLADGKYDAVMAHVAEGRNGNVSAEVDHMFNIGMGGPGYVFVHASDATTEQLAHMRAEGAGIVWSPRSNLDLYEHTTRADIARRMGIPVALAPDWTWSGSPHVPDELACASDYLESRGRPMSDIDIWGMTTHEAALVLGLEGVLGTLEPGMKADISVFSFQAEPYRAVIQASPENVKLVVVEGEALYGTSALMSGRATNPDWCETVDACGESRTLCVQRTASGEGSETYGSLETTLNSALSAISMPSGFEAGNDLMPIWVCDDARPTCASLSTPSDGDADGDSVEDSTDRCPSAWDPLQEDADRDGVGDACDPCPLVPDSATCTHPANDVDEDGIPNDSDLCPWVHDPGNPDSDGDGQPDACDPCPDEADGCSQGVDAITNPQHPNPISNGSSATLTGMVVTGVRANNGFSMQDPNLSEWAGLYVYTAGNPGVSVGDVINITGTVDEYDGLKQLTSAASTKTGTAPIPDAVVISDACRIGTGGLDASRYESMRVQVGPVTVSDSNPDAPNDYGEWEVGSCLRVVGSFCPSCWSDQPSENTSYGKVAGVLLETFGNQKIAPVTGADLAP